VFSEWDELGSSLALPLKNRVTFSKLNFCVLIELYQKLALGFAARFELTKYPSSATSALTLAGRQVRESESS